MTQLLDFNDVLQHAESCRACANLLNTERIPAKVDEFIAAQNDGASFNKLQKLQIEIKDLNNLASDLISNAVRLDSAAIANALLTTDMQEASSVLQCSTEKSLLAVKYIKEVRDMITILEKFIEVGIAIATSLTAIPVSAASILTIIQSVDNLVDAQAELTDAAQEDEVRRAFASKCA